MLRYLPLISNSHFMSISIRNSLHWQNWIVIDGYRRGLCVCIDGERISIHSRRFSPTLHSASPLIPRKLQSTTLPAVTIGFKASYKHENLGCNGTDLRNEFLCCNVLPNRRSSSSQATLAHEGNLGLTISETDQVESMRMASSIPGIQNIQGDFQEKNDGAKPNLQGVDEKKDEVSKVQEAPAAALGENEELLIVASFYKFADLADYVQLRDPIKKLCQQSLVTGGIILAPEGINGSLCGTKAAIESVFTALRGDSRLATLQYREAPAGIEETEMHALQGGQKASTTSPLAPGPDAPFRWDHVRVKLKKEVVTMGVEGISPHELVGKYVTPTEWNELISDPNTLVVDVRNAYETRIGQFKGAVDPKTESFREFPGWVDERLRSDLDSTEPMVARQEEIRGDSTNDVKERFETEGLENEGSVGGKRVAMYCTGGIRCEKATSLMLAKGFKEVYHLEGGILRYLEEIPRSESLWEGECFVFDKRVAVGPGLVPGSYKLCYACKQPVNDADMESTLYEEGVSCPYCYETKSEEEKERARARQIQFNKWGVVGGPHLGRKTLKARERKHG